MTINKSASTLGTIEFTNGNEVALSIGRNSNTGELVVWQQMPGRRASRATGRNIGRIAREVREVLECGDGAWKGEVNQAALDSLMAQA